MNIYDILSERGTRAGVQQASAQNANIPNQADLAQKVTGADQGELSKLKAAIKFLQSQAPATAKPAVQKPAAQKGGLKPIQPAVGATNHPDFDINKAVAGEYNKPRLNQ